jgi:hypothetical protein
MMSVGAGLPLVQLSVAVASKKLTASVHTPAAVFVVMFDGQTMTGAILSTTVIVNEHVAELFAASFTV